MPRPPSDRRRSPPCGTDYLEACVLNEMCSNGEEIFAAGVGDTFVCDYDRARWNAAAAALMSQ